MQQYENQLKILPVYPVGKYPVNDQTKQNQKQNQGPLGRRQIKYPRREIGLNSPAFINRTVGKNDEAYQYRYSGNNFPLSKFKFDQVTICLR